MSAGIPGSRRDGNCEQASDEAAQRVRTSEKIKCQTPRRCRCVFKEIIPFLQLASGLHCLRVRGIEENAMSGSDGGLHPTPYMLHPNPQTPNPKL
eukprot:2624055-Rhodomonas_salina.2